MALTPPAGLIVTVVKWLWAKLTQKLLINTYMHSHEQWASRNRLGARWDSIGDNLKFSIRFGLPTDNRESMTRIAFKTTDTLLSRIEMTIEAEGAGIRYQEHVSLVNVNTSPLVLNLANIPVLDVFFPKESIEFSVNSYQISNCQIWYEDGTREHIKNCQRYYLMHNWCLNDTWIRRWGMTWNCNAIHEAKRRIGDYWKWGFKAPVMGIYPPFTASNSRLYTGQAESLRWLMTRQWCLALQFWLAVWSGLFVMGRDNVLRWRWKKEPKIYMED
jgi:hypothetical protein